MSEKNHTLLIVDDETRISTSLKRMLRNENYIIHIADSGREGLEIIKQHRIGVVMSDLMMPEMDGVTFLGHVKEYDKDIVEILLTAHATLDNALSSINRLQLFGYLTKPWQMEELKGTLKRAFEYHNLIKENIRLLDLTKQQNLELKDMNENLEDLVKIRTLLLEEAVHEGIGMLAMAAEAKDDDTGGHIFRIQSMTFDLCIGMGLDQETAEKIGLFSIIHDIGKIHIPDDILQKPGKLTPTEYELMKGHSEAGERILGVKPFYQTAREIARSHHENWDGSGYPDGLKGDEIPFPARVVAIADVFDALTNKRPYKDAWSRDRAVEEINNLAETKFDPEIVKVFLEIEEKKADRKNGTEK